MKKFENKLFKTDWMQFYERCALAEKTRSHSPSFSVSEAEKEENQILNRYYNILPYNKSRIVLNGVTKRDYINANVVKSLHRKYILCQGPLSSTIQDMWQLIYQEQIHSVVMLCNQYEHGNEQCARYWPSKPGDVLEIQLYGLQVKNKTEEISDNYRVRTFLLTSKSQNNSESPRSVKHFQFTTWPDFGVPKDSLIFLDFLRRVNGVDTEEYSSENSVPILIHCSAGIGRSGTYALVDSCLHLAQMTGEILEFDEIDKILFELRKYRRGLIQTPQQLQFAYKAIHAGMIREIFSSKKRSSKLNKGLYSEHSESTHSEKNKRTRNSESCL